jgi:hypothetical protein
VQFVVGSENKKNKIKVSARVGFILRAVYTLYSIEWSHQHRVPLAASAQVNKGRQYEWLHANI